jgi:hypothetical protein
VLVHFDLFWFLPISGNILLYDSPSCLNKYDMIMSDPCMDYHSNKYFTMFYWCWILYFMMSARQLRHGLPISKVASSVTTRMDEIGMLGAQIYVAIPFAIEIRCLLDFAFSKTALDNFQFW